MWIALILLILFALVVLAGFVLALIAGIQYKPRFGFLLPFTKALEDDFFTLIWMLNQVNTLWHPGRGYLPNPSEDTSTHDFPTHPME
jgi:hypothetical protein